LRIFISAPVRVGIIFLDVLKNILTLIVTTTSQHGAGIFTFLTRRRVFHFLKLKPFNSSNHKLISKEMIKLHLKICTFWCIAHNFSININSAISKSMFLDKLMPFEGYYSYQYALLDLF